MSEYLLVFQIGLSVLGLFSDRRSNTDHTLHLLAGPVLVDDCGRHGLLGEDQHHLEATDFFRLTGVSPATFDSLDTLGTSWSWTETSNYYGPSLFSVKLHVFDNIRVCVCFA